MGLFQGQEEHRGEFDLSFYELWSLREGFLNFQQTVRLCTEYLAFGKTERARESCTDYTRNVSISKCRLHSMPKKPLLLSCKGSCFSDRLVNSNIKDTPNCKNVVTEKSKKQKDK